MHETLSGCKVAILAVDGFEQRRFFEMRGRLVDAGAITTIVSSTHDDLICSWQPSGNGSYAAVDRHVCDVHPAYDALFLPGTVVDAEAVFVDPWTADFVKSFFDLGRPIASLCRDRWLFVHRTNVIGGRMKPDSQLLPQIVLTQSTAASRLDRDTSCDDLDGFARKMLAFFQAGLTSSSPTVTARAEPSRQSFRPRFPPPDRAAAGA